uniref:Uncharacterized protein n=1 Tax=Oryza glumipatula TaxID=40148 RepID=A0A0D9Y3Z8_9ORYZ
MESHEEEPRAISLEVILEQAGKSFDMTYMHLRETRQSDENKRVYVPGKSSNVKSDRGTPMATHGSDRHGRPPQSPGKADGNPSPPRLIQHQIDTNIAGITRDAEQRRRRPQGHRNTTRAGQSRART